MTICDLGFAISDWTARESAVRSSRFNRQSSIILHQFEDSNAVYYYHFDGLGSVVALSDAAGDTVQLYEYSVYGQVAASDPNHTNPFLFTGRRMDADTGLYYYRARYYNPYIGRFLQTDPIGYGDGVDLYRYCRNNPVRYVDPSGCRSSGCGHNPPCIYPGPNDPNWLLPTGNWMVLPGGLTPGNLQDKMDIEVFINAMQMVLKARGYGNWIGKPALEILEDLIPNPASTLVDLYAQAIEAGVNAIYEIVARNRGYWRAFIEIQNYQRYPVEGDPGHFTVRPAGTPRWVEVVNLRGYVGVEGRHVGGYVGNQNTNEGASLAAKAARKGIDFWRCHMCGHSVPEGDLSQLMGGLVIGDIYGSKEYTYTGPTFLSAFVGVDPGLNNM